MAQRGHEAPMDFSWNDGVGPVDTASPFASVSRTTNAFKSTTATLSPLASTCEETNLRNFPDPFGSFQSQSQSQPPIMRAPASQPHSFSSTNKPLPARPSSSAADSKSQPIDFVTPRKQKPLVDLDTSGGETPNTPDNNADSEATPASKMGVKSFIFGASTKDPSSPSPDKAGKRRRESVFKNLFSSSGRGEIRPLPHNPESKVKKKRSKKALIRKLEKEDTDYIDEDGDSSPVAPKNAKPPKKKRNVSNNAAAMTLADQHPQQRTANGSWYSFFDFLESHPSLPTVLSYYAQLLLNCFIIFGIMYIFYSFYATIRSDVDEAAAHAEAEALAEIVLCVKNYKENECDGGANGRVLPAMEQVCKNWEQCSKRDPKKVGRARVSAHTFARIFNSFIEPISYKAMIFTLFVIFGTVFISNLAFGFFRSKAAGAASFTPQQYLYPPATPSRHPSGAGMLEGPYGGPFTPHHPQWQYGIEPAPSQVFGRTPSGGASQGQGSPVKKLDFL
ncbi:hypothetical protein NA57DRAFT_77374 [Rhizodiscina lignyota]|uniref:Brl1/Brr6 domain-containing protein n=1 Tax=Rhizodiscina lignyota TaxID=1504668 RepID=A0A9P4M8S8_9PEZI|nr:hypothetical protein NA57DRAFT_77374 [Rhizodiscina lignyota]